MHVSVCITIPVLNQMKRAVHKQTAPAAAEEGIAIHSGQMRGEVGAACMQQQQQQQRDARFLYMHGWRSNALYA